MAIIQELRRMAGSNQSSFANSASCTLEICLKWSKLLQMEILNKSTKYHQQPKSKSGSNITQTYFWSKTNSTQTSWTNSSKTWPEPSRLSKILIRQPQVLRATWNRSICWRINCYAAIPKKLRVCSYVPLFPWRYGLSIRPSASSWRTIRRISIVCGESKKLMLGTSISYILILMLRKTNLIESAPRTTFSIWKIIYNLP